MCKLCTNKHFWCVKARCSFSTALSDEITVSWFFEFLVVIPVTPVVSCWFPVLFCQVSVLFDFLVFWNPRVKFLLFIPVSCVHFYNIRIFFKALFYLFSWFMLPPFVVFVPLWWPHVCHQCVIISTLLVYSNPCDSLVLQMTDLLVPLCLSIFFFCIYFSSPDRGLFLDFARALSGLVACSDWLTAWSVIHVCPHEFAYNK